MPTTLLAIDDSVTMRKVLEMTFAGEDYRVVTADSADAAFAKLRSERPAVVLCDITLDGPGGYAICAKIKTENPTVAVVLLASKQQPYDTHKGQNARADDFIEKPFDTQQLIDKVKRLTSRPVVAEAPARPSPMAAATQPGVAPAATAGRPGPAPGARPTGGPPGATAPLNPRFAPGAGGVAQGIGRGTLAYGGYVGPNPAPSAPAPAGPAGGFATRPPTVPVSAAPPPAAAPLPSVTALGLTPHAAAVVPAAAAAAAAVAAVSGASNGQLAARLAHLGLSDVQVSAVLSLSREVIEKVVWEVVPVLAETMIREELRRLTSE